MIQNGGNYIFLHTYTFTIDIVPLVLWDYYFVGHIHEYKGIIIKIRHQKSVMQIILQRMRRQPIQRAKLGQAPM